MLKSKFLLSKARFFSTKPVFITTPIFYVNADPHIGHLYSLVVSDTLSRWHRFLGNEAFLSTGTDEHGLKVQQAAAKHNIPPSEFCDRVSGRFRELAERSGAQVDAFVRTTQQDHVEAVRDLWQRIEKNGFIYKGFHEGWYSVSDETFVPDAQVGTNDQGQKISLETGNLLEWVKEENYKFALSKFQQRLADWLVTTDPQPVFPHSKTAFVMNMVNTEMQDLSVSRLTSKVRWGIPVPGDPAHTIYVWLDALTNYLTVTGYPWQQGPNQIWPADYHIVGKDIVKFHAVYWPAFLMAAGLPLPKRVVAHGHWTIEGEKMSKSKGNVVNPFEAIEMHGADALRYYLMRYGSFVDDGGYSDTLVAERRTSDLSNSLGNLFSRVTSVALNPRQSWPEKHLSSIKESTKLTEILNGLPETVRRHMDKLEFQQGLGVVFEAITEMNRLINLVEPWKLGKGKPKENPERLEAVVYLGLETCRLAGLFLQPVMPGAMKRLLDQLGVKEEERGFKAAKWGNSPLGRTVVPTVLFPRMGSAKKTQTSKE